MRREHPEIHHGLGVAPCRDVVPRRTRCKVEQPVHVLDFVGALDEQAWVRVLGQPMQQLAIAGDALALRESRLDRLADQLVAERDPAADTLQQAALLAFEQPCRVDQGKAEQIRDLDRFGDGRQDLEHLLGADGQPADLGHHRIPDGDQAHLGGRNHLLHQERIAAGRSEHLVGLQPCRGHHGGDACQ